MKKREFPIFFLDFVRVFSDFWQNSAMLKILCILMQKNFCSLFTFPVFGSGSVYTFFVEKRGIHLTNGEIQRAPIYKKDGITALSGNPCNWVPYG